jgi:large subunit ribosomal protein L5
MSQRLHERYASEIVPALTKQFEYRNPMQVPRVSKVIVNIGLGEALTNAKAIDAATGDLALITGQRPIVTRAKRSIAQFRLRTGNPIGAKVTLRGERMWDFLDRLISLALPRIRDFRGIPSRSFDGRGNYSLGVREQLIFPEIDYDSIDEVRGLDIAITTTAASDEEGFELLLGLGMPFAQDGRPGQVDTAAEEEEERRHEEARQRAEAEQAALEQLKEENPEAYAKPVRHEEGEEGEEGAEGAAASDDEETSSEQSSEE